MSIIFRSDRAMSSPPAGTPQIPIPDMPWTSDSFGVGDLAEIVGRTSDAALGGLGKPWVGTTGAARILGGRLAAAAAPQSIFFVGMLALADQEISCTLHALPAVSIFLDARRQGISGAPNGYRLEIAPNGVAQVLKRVGGSMTALITGATVGVGNVVGLRTRGNQISLVINGSVVGTVTDADVPGAGYTGVAGFSTSTGWQLDDLRVTAR